ncbi:MAG: CAP domain-containing protein [Myxococcales bacterium]|nr:CAP domain-containing protein [Myxococcales bacterium]
MLGFRSSSGATLTESQCVSACAAGQFGGAESCLATAPCGAASLNACFSSSPPSTPDASPPTDASGGTPPPSSGATALEDEVLALTNARRAAGANCGGTMFGPAPPLRMNETLRGVARAHSTDMGTRNYFAHNSLDGRTPFQRMMAAGYSSSPMGENIAAGNGTAAATVTQWMNSPGHCRNIMNPSYRALGVGYANVASSMYRHYWTQNFGGM